MTPVKLSKQTDRSGKISGLLGNKKLTTRILPAITLLLALSAVCWIFLRHRPHVLDYSIKPLPGEEQELQVSVEIGKLKADEVFELYRGDISYSEAECLDDKGNKMEFSEKGGFIEIPNKGGSNIRFTYSVKLGQPDKHGHRGGSYQDLLAFDGGEALILPSSAFNTGKGEVEDSIGRISIAYDVPEDWTAVVPFPETNGGRTVTVLSKPGWPDIYDLTKSCFAFGRFQQYTYEKDGGGRLQVFVDPAYEFSYTGRVEQGLNKIYEYYSDLFNDDIGFSILLLRKDVKDGLYLMGGSSTQTLGTTFDPENARDWQLMGHRFFHAFFDTAVRQPLFHAAPQLWFYEGLATYYENMSMGSLPEDIRKKAGLPATGDFLTLFKQYAYMRIKDKYIYTLTPMNEEKYEEYKGVTEFLHYTEAPLAIKAIDDAAYSKYREHDRVLKYILKNRSGKDPDLNETVRYAMGDEAEDFMDKYMYNNGFLPLWYLGENETEDIQKTIRSLNDMEYTQWTWFRLVDPAYPQDTLSEKGLQVLTDEAEKAETHFAGQTVEDEVEKLSPAVYGLLKQYALRAKICGTDMDNKLLRYELLGDKENMESWNSFIKNLNID